MPILVWEGKQSCGMGGCMVFQNYFADKKYLLSTLPNLPEECKKCVEKTRELEEKLIKCQ